MDNKSCAICTHAMPISGSDWVECRKYPPTGSKATPSGFPLSLLTSWCGEFKKHIVSVQITERV